VRLSFIQAGLPWVVAAVGFLLYAVTLNRWVTLDSLPYVAKVTGWDWTLPYQTPLFFLLTYPFRWLPPGWQPVSLNVFSAACSALTLALLARSVALLPHDRTHEQRQRERSEFSLLSIPGAWLPPVLAVFVCGLELTFWEHSTAATNESLDLLVFAYVIRCLMEFRISQNESWLTRMSFVYGLGVTNNFALIGFFPCVLLAVLWIKGLSFFEFRFFIRMLAFGLVGLLLYFLLPLVWANSDNPAVSFGQALRAHLAGQKAVLFDAPQLRTRALLLSLTSILPLLIIGIRWPATFGDTSAAGAALSSIMFRVVHTVFLGACILVAFDQQFSPRALAGGALPFLSFYYLGALSVGYFSGYLLLVFGEGRAKSRHRRSGLELLLGRVVVAAVWLALLAVPVALMAKNWKSIQASDGRLLTDLTELSIKPLPPAGGIVLGDDAYALLLLSAGLSHDGLLNKYLMVHTRSLLGPDYHRELHKRYPDRWPNFFTNEPPDEVVDDSSLLMLVSALSRTNEIYYLHPSFGYYFEPFYLQPHGLVYQLRSYATNAILPPALNPADLKENEGFWKQKKDSLKVLAANNKLDSRDARYVCSYYSRAVNTWGVMLQRNQHSDQARQYFQLAADLNTNNVPAQSNLEFNRALTSGQGRTMETSKSIEDKFGMYRGWERMLLDNGPFDQPEFCMKLGQIFGQQGLYRQSIIQWDRVRALDPTNLVATLALAEVYLNARYPAKSLEELARLRGDQKTELPPEAEQEIARVQATALFNLGRKDEAEKALLDGFAKFPKNPGILDTLLQIYEQTGRFQDAIDTAEKIIQADPDRAQSYINEAQLYRSKQENDKAMAVLDRILKKFQTQPQVLLYKIYTLIELKSFSQAAKDVDRLLSVDPDNFEALLYKGVINIETKSFQPAIEPLSRVLQRQPGDVHALRNRGWAYLQMGELPKAEKDYNTLRRLAYREYVYVAYYGLGEIAYRRHDTDTARKYYDLYLLYAPKQDTPDLQEEKKLVTSRLNELKEARR
jgi:tetratricopeptide (TPR) repeat protein